MSITSDIADGILECADKSTVGKMTYHHGHIHFVVPLSVGVSRKGNEVLYCWERDRTTKEFGTRMFKVSETHYAATWLLHPDAPKVEMPRELRLRLERSRKAADD